MFVVVGMAVVSAGAAEGGAVDVTGGVGAGAEGLVEVGAVAGAVAGAGAGAAAVVETTD